MRVKLAFNLELYFVILLWNWPKLLCNLFLKLWRFNKLSSNDTLRFSSLEKVKKLKPNLLVCGCMNALNSKMKIIHKMRSISNKTRSYIDIWAHGFITILGSVWFKSGFPLIIWTSMICLIVYSSVRHGPNKIIFQWSEGGNPNFGGFDLDDHTNDFGKSSTWISLSVSFFAVFSFDISHIFSML